MKQHSKLSSEQQQKHVGQQKQKTGQEFASAEELLRYDAANTAIPPAIAERLQKSAAALPQPKPAWWKRLLGGSS